MEQFGPQQEERERLATRMRADGMPEAAALAALFVTRIRVRVDDKGDYSAFELRLNGIPFSARAAEVSTRRPGREPGSAGRRRNR